jgi:2-dehydro-3-deoxygluconokinase
VTSEGAPGDGLVTLGETMGMVVQAVAGPAGNGAVLRLGVAGSESNVAIGVRRLGRRATWIGRLGGDQFGELIARELRAEAVEVVSVTDAAPTGLLVRWRPTEARSRVDYYRRGSAGAHLQAADIPVRLIESASVLHVTGITPALGASPAEAVWRAVTIARAAGVPVSFDVNYRRTLWSRKQAAEALRPLVASADIVFAGADEAGLFCDAAEPAAAALALAGQGPAQAVVTLGAAGAVAVIDGVAYRQSAHEVPVLDTVGAGDAFVAGYLADLLEGAPPQQRLATAAACGAMAVMTVGDWEALPRRRDLEWLEDAEPVER